MSQQATMADIKQIIGSIYESINAHMLSIEELCKMYDTDIDIGLTEEQAKENLRKYGPNEMDCWNEPIVKRGGDPEDPWMTIQKEELVPGDIIKIGENTGEVPGFIAGDIRILSIIEPLFVESSFLYNDYPNYRKEITTEQTSEDPLETNNLVFYGTNVFAGSAIGIVFQTAEKKLLWDCPDKVTPLYKLDYSSPWDFYFHDGTIESICEMFSTDIEKGLTTEQATINCAKSGENKYNYHEKIMNDTKCKRDGELQNIMSISLTIGDIIFLKAPQVAPTDLRIIEASADCTVNKSFLTGNGEPQKGSTEKTSENPMETENAVFALTRITSGTCTGIVVQVGGDTMMGKLSGLTSTFG